MPRAAFRCGRPQCEEGSSSHCSMRCWLTCSGPVRSTLIGARFHFSSVLRQTWSAKPDWPGAAAVFALTEEATCSFTQRRPEGRYFSSPRSAAPILFDPLVPFQLSDRAPGQVVALAYQPCARFGLDGQLIGRPKSLGSTWGNATAWIPPRRVPFNAGSLKDGSIVYIGPGSKQWNLLASRWAKTLEEWCWPQPQERAGTL